MTSEVQLRFKVALSLGLIFRVCNKMDECPKNKDLVYIAGVVVCMC